MRLIDADAFLTDSIKKKRFFIYTEDALNNVFVVSTVYDDLKKALGNAPTIDAVEVIRCRDCIHYSHVVIDDDPAETVEVVVCAHKDLFPTRVTPDFFCAHGKHKPDAEVQHEKMQSVR